MKNKSASTSTVCGVLLILLCMPQHRAALHVNVAAGHRIIPRAGQPTPIQMRVGPGGGLALAIPNHPVAINISSTFSEPGPVLRALNWSASPADNGWNVTVDRSQGDTVFVLARSHAIEISRKYVLQPHRVLVNDTVRFLGQTGTLYGTQIRHYGFSGDASE